MRTFVAAAVLLLATSVVACPLCVGTAGRSSAQDFDDLSRVVLAAPQANGYRVVDVIKGMQPEPVLKDVVVREPATPGKALLLVRDDAWPMWVSLGSLSVRQVRTLRVLAEPHPAESDLTAWRRRLEVALPHLESREALMAELAYAECATTPYAALRSAAARLDAASLRRWANDPALSARMPLYVLLLGVAGGQQDATIIEAKLEAALDVHDASHMASLLAADLEVRGPSRMAWVEERILRDPTRTTVELQAALLALAVQANSGGAITRDRVIAAYRIFMRERRDMAGLVAPDLAAWQYWDATPEFAALLAGNVRQQYASREAIVAYLRQSPLGEGAMSAAPEGPRRAP